MFRERSISLLAHSCVLLLALLILSACTGGKNGNNADNNTNNATVNNDQVDMGPPALTCEPLDNRRCECEIGTGEQTCHPDGGEWNACICPIKELVPREGVLEIEPAIPGSTRTAGQTLFMPLRGNGEFRDIEPGTLIYVLEGKGLLGRVLAVAETDEEIVITTQEVMIGEAFEKLVVDMKDVAVDVNSYESDEMKAALQAEASSHDSTVSRGITYDKKAWSIRPSGSASFDIGFGPGSRGWFVPTLDSDLELAWPDPFEPPVLSYFTFQAGLDAGFILEPNISVSGFGQVSFETELIQLAQQLKGNPQPQALEIPLGAGFSAEVTLNLRCQLGIEGDANMTTSFGLTIDASGGLTYEGGEWSTNEHAEVSAPTGDVQQADLVGDVFLRCEFKPRLRLRFLKAVYAFVEAGPYAKATQSFREKKAFSVVAGFNGIFVLGAEIDLDVWVLTLFEKTYNLFEIAWNIYERQFAVCGDGFRGKDSERVLDGEEVVSYREECDSGGHDDPLAVTCDADCTCAPGYKPSEEPDYTLVPWEGQWLETEDPSRWEHGFPYNLCVTLCGNGVVDDGEVCDNGMRIDTCGPDGCSRDCKRRVGICGDGFTDAFCGELCDDGEDPNSADDACDSCVGCFLSQICGDRRTDVDCGEECDDGGDPDDRCDAQCKTNVGTCGDGIINYNGPNGAMEECDDGNLDPCDGCDWNCRIVTNGCGDGFVCGTEDCEPSIPGVNELNCDADCTVRICGDGYHNPVAESCDETSATCDPDCTPTTCGDGTINVVAGEECDEGGVATAACNADCTRSVCGDGKVNAPFETCDDGDADNCTTACNAACTGPATAPVCGDGFVDSGCGNEVCDDGGLNGTCGHCSADCLTAPTNVCGDGVKSGCEACDDGNTDDGDGCRGDCQKVEACGDAFIDAGEACDDGDNTICGGTCKEDCSGPYADVCGDGSQTGCEACEDTDPTNTSVDQGCTAGAPNCNGCNWCSADVCGDGIIGASEACDPGGTCQEEDVYCTIYDTSNCTVQPTAPCFFNEFECAGSCTRVVTCGDGFKDGAEECDGGAGCLPDCTFGP